MDYDLGSESSGIRFLVSQVQVHIDKHSTDDDCGMPVLT